MISFKSVIIVVYSHLCIIYYIDLLQVQNLILSFPLQSSHYSQRDNNNKRYLSLKTAFYNSHAPEFKFITWRRWLDAFYNQQVCVFKDLKCSWVDTSIE